MPTCWITQSKQVNCKEGETVVFKFKYTGKGTPIFSKKSCGCTTPYYDEKNKEYVLSIKVGMMSIHLVRKGETIFTKSVWVELETDCGMDKLTATCKSLASPVARCKSLVSYYCPKTLLFS